MATQIKDAETQELLWQADDFGKYSLDKIQAISTILKSLLTDITIHMDTSINEESLANVYTKDESNKRFVLVEALNQSVEGAVSALVVAGKIPGITSLDLINTRLETLNVNCTGYDYAGNKRQAGYKELIDNLDTDITNTNNNVLRVIQTLYEENSDGTYDFEKVLVAKISETGVKTNLNSEIKDRSTLVAAINSLFQEISETKSSISGASTAVADISKVKQDIQTATQDLSQVKTQTSSLIQDMTNVKSQIGSIQNLSSNESSIVEALNNISTKLDSLSQSVVTFDADLNLLKQRVSDLEGSPTS